MDRKTFDEQCRLCKFLKNPPPCGKEKMENVDGVEVCTGYEAEEV